MICKLIPYFTLVFEFPKISLHSCHKHCNQLNDMGIRLQQTCHLLTLLPQIAKSL